jgi:ATP-dependent Lon protease
VMQESASAAHSWVRAHARSLGLDPKWFEENDVHVHVPAGAVPKDGPSAGIAIATAIVSLVRGEPVSEDVAMTGEITLTGQVLQIGGVREKVLAAQRAGIQRVVLPRENEPDLEDLPAEAREQIEFVLADTVEDVLDAAFEKVRPLRTGRREARRRSAAMPA